MKEILRASQSQLPPRTFSLASAVCSTRCSCAAQFLPRRCASAAWILDVENKTYTCSIRKLQTLTFIHIFQSHCRTGCHSSTVKSPNTTPWRTAPSALASCTHTPARDSHRQRQEHLWWAHVPLDGHGQTAGIALQRFLLWSTRLSMKQTRSQLANSRNGRLQGAWARMKPLSRL